MRTIEYRAEAKNDLDEIASYTKARWGSHQAARYLSALHQDVQSLSDFPERFPRHTGRYSQLRKMRSGHHLVFYLVTEAAVEIIRILHERQDVPPGGDV